MKKGTEQILLSDLNRDVSMQWIMTNEEIHSAQNK